MAIKNLTNINKPPKYYLYLYEYKVFTHIFEKAISSFFEHFDIVVANVTTTFFNFNENNLKYTKEGNLVY